MRSRRALSAPLRRQLRAAVADARATVSYEGWQSRMQARFLAGNGLADAPDGLDELPSEIFAAADAPGWAYQFWQAEEKAANGAGATVRRDGIGPVTQLFTERYMVRFLLENTLGAWWAAKRAGSFEYLRLGAPAGWPARAADITVMDPCCGTGHFLVEAFDLLWRMRAEEEGLDAADAQDAVLADNLLGLDLDPRCIEIARFSLQLEAWKTAKRELPPLNVACSGATDDVLGSLVDADDGRRFTLVATNVPYLLRRRQDPRLKAFADRHHPRAKADLATMFLERAHGLLEPGGTAALVTPNAWTHLGSYERLRRHLLATQRIDAVARLGTGAFDAISGEVVNVLLWIAANEPPPAGHRVAFLDASRAAGPDGKMRALQLAPIRRVNQADYLGDPAARIGGAPPARARHGLPLLSDYAHAYKGLTTGDDPRWKRRFWELPDTTGWHELQTASSEDVLYGGCSYVVDFDGMTNPLQPGVEVRGQHTWGRRGVAVSQMSLAAGLSTGAKFDQNVAVLIPHDERDLPAVLAFTRSPDYRRLIREIDQGLKVTNATLTQVPFDAERWRREATPLPAPHSGDPTQWLFDGCTPDSRDALQVKVANLLGYRWPRQPPDGTPTDPILTSPAGRLRDDFFKQHCALFANRPFIWHITDGRRDGFHAFVNYHRFDRAALDRLTHDHLNHWIARHTGPRREAAEELQRKLQAILTGEPPYDIHVRWKPIEAQPLGWEPDFNDGVRVNVRPFVLAGVLRARFNVHYKPDRGRNADGSLRHNDCHLTLAEKRAARARQAQAEARQPAQP